MAGVDLTGVGAEVEQLLIQGRAALALIGAAQDSSLLVVGSRGRGGFAGLLLGSVSQQVAHEASVPVVIIPPAATVSSFERGECFQVRLAFDVEASLASPFYAPAPTVCKNARIPHVSLRLHKLRCRNRLPLGSSGPRAHLDIGPKTARPQHARQGSPRSVSADNGVTDSMGQRQ